MSASGTSSAATSGARAIGCGSPPSCPTSKRIRSSGPTATTASWRSVRPAGSAGQPHRLEPRAARPRGRAHAGAPQAPESINAYDLVMQAIDLIYRMTFADFSAHARFSAGDLARRQLRRCPHVRRALARPQRQSGLDQRSGSGYPRGRTARRRGVERDPTDGFALAVHGHTRSVLFRDFDTAIGIFDRALAAAPGNAMVWTLSSGIHAYIGDGASAVARAERGLRLSPGRYAGVLLLASLRSPTT